ncbi:MAG: dihydropteroate synthase [Lachnospiraceae bacterium]|nr:dihydropteroate synthase [Lachnospiraceae bacterium]
MIIGSKVFDPGHTYIMGILNVTPDSFSDGGCYNTLDKALKHAEEMIAEGADVIDIGGESTRPGYTHISVDEEIKRTAPVIEAVTNAFDIPVSIDTYKPAVAEQAVQSGAALINDIWGLKGEDLLAPDSGMAEVIKKYNASCCIMHNRVLTEELQEKERLAHFLISDVIIKELNESLDIAYRAGIDKNRILLDPGVGFGKTYEDNVNTIKELEKICDAFELPMLLGTSKKSVIGLTLGVDKSERLEGTLATTARAVDAGCMFVRVHDVKANARFIKMYETVARTGRF